MTEVATLATPTVSFGGGRQTVAMLVLAAQDRIPHRRFLFANVGDRAENPDTLVYFHEHAVPYAEAHGLELRELRWIDRTGRVRDLYDDIVRLDRSMHIPVRDDGGFGNRKCTARYKIEVVAREMKRLGGTVDNPAEVAIGISVDEIERAHPGVDKRQPWTTKTYPLLDLGLRVSDCLRIVADAGLPQPPRSACSFCPFQGQQEWQRQRREHPALFERNVALDALLRARHERLRRGPAGLASPTVTLDRAVSDQMSFGDCDSGWCMT
jgi:hypothetical protein